MTLSETPIPCLTYVSAAAETTTGDRLIDTGILGWDLPVGDYLVAVVTYAGGTALVDRGTMTDNRGGGWVLQAASQGSPAPLVWTEVWTKRITLPWREATDKLRYTLAAASGSRVLHLHVIGMGGGGDDVDFTIDVDTASGVGTAVSTPNLTGQTTIEVDNKPQAWLFVGVGSTGGATGVPGSGLSEWKESAPLTAAGERGIWVGRKTVTSTAAVAMSMTLSASTTWAAVSVLFRPEPLINPPQAAARPIARVLKPGKVYQLDASGSTNDNYDPPGVLAYSWAQTYGPSVGAITNATSAIASFTAPAGAPGTTLGFTVTVTNDRGGVDDTSVNYRLGPVPASVAIKLGDVEVDIDLDRNSGATVDDALLVLDGLTIEWRYIDPVETVRQLEPMVASLQLSTRDVDQLAQLNEGAPAYVIVRDEYGDHVASVFGRTGELTAQQRLETRPDTSKVIRTTVAVDIVDHTASEGWTVDELVLPLQTWQDRVNALVGAVRASDSAAVDDELQIRHPPEDTSAVEVAGRCRAQTYTSTGLIELVRSMLSEMPLATTPTSSTDDSLYVGHLMLAPISTGGIFSGVLDHMGLHVVPGIESPVAHLYFDVPNRFAPPVGHPHRIDAGDVELSGTFRKASNDRPNAVAVKLRNNADTNDASAVVRVARNGRARITKTLDAQTATQLPAGQISSTYGSPIARMHLPESDVTDGWDREGFVYRPSSWERVSGGEARGWFPNFDAVDDTGPGWRWFPTVNWQATPMELAAACFLVPVQIDGIPAHGSLSRADGAYIGHLSGAKLTIEDALPTISFELRRTEPDDPDDPIYVGQPSLDPN